MGLPTTARLAAAEVVTLASVVATWGDLKQWPSLLFPREGEVLGGSDAAYLAGLEGFSGPWQLSCFWLSIA